MVGMDVKDSIHVYYCRNAAGSEMPAGLAKLSRRRDVLLEEVPCAGRTDPRYLLKAFETGARAVCILACPRGNCKSMEGNLRANVRVQGVQELLSEAGLDAHSIQIFIPNDSTEAELNAKIQSIIELVGEVAV